MDIMRSHNFMLSWSGLPALGVYMAVMTITMLAFSRIPEPHRVKIKVPVPLNLPHWTAFSLSLFSLTHTHTHTHTHAHAHAQQLTSCTSLADLPKR